MLGIFSTPHPETSTEARRVLLWGNVQKPLSAGGPRSIKDPARDLVLSGRLRIDEDHWCEGVTFSCFNLDKQ
jgi:hypothetical protein